MPAPGAIDTSGLDIGDAVMDALLSVDPESWRAELPQIEEHYAGIGDSLPTALQDELHELEKRLAQ